MFLHPKPKQDRLPISEKLWIIRHQAENERLSHTKIVFRIFFRIFVLEPVPEPENSEPKSKKPKVQQKMTKYFSVNSAK